MLAYLFFIYLFIFNVIFRVCYIDNDNQSQLFNIFIRIYCVKFSSYNYHNYRENVICSSSNDNDIRFWDFKSNNELKILNGLKVFVELNFHYLMVVNIYDLDHLTKTFVETSKLLNFSMDIWTFNNIDDNNKSNNIGVIGGNRYKICSGL
ncbi:hypothetical protein RFI_14166 [Reticulomyxa filosa]|uniref:F-box and wd40 domain protein n=1 Tax=Reticulomyxa filosa TaxID=46433 RepID=X6NCH0_RETFI|nr:hypothetical protein RFI_14166 [Reticulomyxa filosa]|eukprot:ETO23017.1 hypothetical protein RFI_14166 [Reticulomyxa filosa]